MIEIYGDIWELAKTPAILCITTNGIVKNNGEAVMGKGVAREARVRFPDIADDLGLMLKTYGNHVFDLGICDGYWIFTFPTKHHWHDKSDLKLIEKSAYQLVCLISNTFHNPELKVFIPRPGCNNGGLIWGDVKGIIDPILDDRFYITTYKQ